MAVKQGGVGIDEIQVGLADDTVFGSAEIPFESTVAEHEHAVGILEPDHVGHRGIEGTEQRPFFLRASQGLRSPDRAFGCFCLIHGGSPRA